VPRAVDAARPTLCSVGRVDVQNGEIRIQTGKLRVRRPGSHYEEATPNEVVLVRTGRTVRESGNFSSARLHGGPHPKPLLARLNPESWRARSRASIPM
jgi:hypothetical protein